MKKCIILSLLSIVSILAMGQSKIDGAWETKIEQGKLVMIIADNYMSAALYDLPGKKFISTHGGRITALTDKTMTLVTEFNSAVKEQVGTTMTMGINTANGKLAISYDGNTMELTRIDEGGKFLAGNWRITQREQNGQLTPIHTTGARKTIKILSGTRFQWAAINTETGEFSGTGGGTYTLKDGIYTENIEFFSRDSSRVGMSLSFNGKLDKNDWYHSGKSSRGDPINEVWSRR
jgi:hypothetical protein